MASASGRPTLTNPNAVLQDFYRPGSGFDIFDNSAAYYADVNLNTHLIAGLALQSLGALGIQGVRKLFSDAVGDLNLFPFLPSSFGNAADGQLNLIQASYSPNVSGGSALFDAGPIRSRTIGATRSEVINDPNQPDVVIGTIEYSNVLTQELRNGIWVTTSRGPESVSKRIDYILQRDSDGRIVKGADGSVTRIGQTVDQDGLAVRQMFRSGVQTDQDGTLRAGEVADTISSDIIIPGNPPIDFSQAGGILGQQLGYRLAKGNVLVGVVSSAVLQTIGDNLGDVFDGLLFSTNGNANGVEEVVDKAFSEFGDEFLTNLQSAGLGAISSFLTAELINALGVDGLAGEVLNSAGGVVIGQIVTNIVNGAKIFSEINPAAIGSAVGSLLGNKLAAEVVTFGSVGGQIGAALGSTLAVVAASALAGGPIGVVPAAIAAFIGNLIGGAIGSVFGGTPRSGADASWDEASGRFVVSNVYSKKGGSKDAARSVAGAVADTFNAVLEAAGGTLLDPEAVQSGNYGMRKSDFVYRPVSTRDKDAITQRFSGADAATKLIGYGVVQGLTDPDFRIAGGDVYVKRALYNTFAGGVDARAFDVATITGNIASAQAYESYLANASVIGALVAAESDSVFAIETAITLARAVELGLTRGAEVEFAANNNEVVQNIAA